MLKELNILETFLLTLEFERVRVYSSGVLNNSHYYCVTLH